MAGPLDHVAQVVTGSGSPVGMATLVQDVEGTLITCAHVVRAALGDSNFDPHTQEPATIALRWVSQPHAMGWATVLADGWTSSEEFAGGDLAVLQLRSALPDRVHSAAFVSGVEVDGHRFQVYGAGAEDPAPVRATGEIGGREGVGGVWRSLLTDERGRKVEQGFSGGAVWDETLRYFVGMVVTRELGDDSDRTFFSPSEELVRLWPRLGRVVRSSFEISRDAREHWLPRARGVTNAAETGWYFSGRDLAVDELTSAARPSGRGGRFFAVTGRPGSGKSGLLARLPIIADPRLSQLAQLSADQVRLPGVKVIPVNLRQQNAADFFDHLSKSVGTTVQSVDGFLDALRNSRDLARVQKILVLDGLDEAADETARMRIARSVRQIAQASPLLSMTVVVACRSGVADSENARLIAALGTKCVRIDVESTRYVQKSDFQDFVERRLLDETAGSPYSDQLEKVETIAALVTASAYPNYLVAQLVTRALLDDPEISEAQLHDRAFPSTVDEAFDDYLDRFEQDAPRARHLMAGLAHARGPGFTAGELWLRATHVVTGRRYEEADLVWLLESAAAFLIESSEVASGPRYRLYHQALVDMLAGGAALAVYEECVSFSNQTVDPEDVAYLRDHLSGHALAAERLSELLLSPDTLLRCSTQAVLDDSSRTDVALSDDAQKARSALRAVQHELDGSLDGERCAYLAMAGHQFGVPALTQQAPQGNWWVSAAAWRASSDHLVLARGRPFTTVAYALIGQDEVAIAGDADGLITFESLDGTGEARPPIQFAGSVTQLVVTGDGRDIFFAVGTDIGEVHLVRVLADTTVRHVRAARFDAAVVGLVLTCSGRNSSLLAASADGELILDERRGLRSQAKNRERFREPIRAIAGLRGGHNTVVVVTPNSKFAMVRTGDLETIDTPTIEWGESVFQLLDSWHSSDEESSALFTSASGIGRIGLEFGLVKPTVPRRSAARFVCTPVDPMDPKKFVMSDGTSIVICSPQGEHSRLRGHADAVTGLGIAPAEGGARILSIADDGFLRLWDLPRPKHDESEDAQQPNEWAGLEIEDSTRLGAASTAEDDLSRSTEAASAFAISRRLTTQRPSPWLVGDEVADECWAQVQWEVDDEELLLVVSETYVAVAQLSDLGPDWLRQSAYGASEATGSLAAVVGQLVGGKAFFFVADGRELRVFDGTLDLIASIAISGGPVRSLDVTITRTAELAAEFVLRCEAGVIEGRVLLPET